MNRVKYGMLAAASLASYNLHGSLPHEQTEANKQLSLSVCSLPHEIIGVSKEFKSSDKEIVASMRVMKNVHTKLLDIPNLSVTPEQARVLQDGTYEEKSEMLRNLLGYRATVMNCNFDPSSRTIENDQSITVPVIVSNLVFKFDGTTFNRMDAVRGEIKLLPQGSVDGLKNGLYTIQELQEILGNQTLRVQIRDKKLRRPITAQHFNLDLPISLSRDLLSTAHFLQELSDTRAPQRLSMVKKDGDMYYVDYGHLITDGEMEECIRLYFRTDQADETVLEQAHEDMYLDFDRWFPGSNLLKVQVGGHVLEQQLVGLNGKRLADIYWTFSNYLSRLSNRYKHKSVDMYKNLDLNVIQQLWQSWIGQAN